MFALLQRHQLPVFWVTLSKCSLSARGPWQVISQLAVVCQLNLGFWTWWNLSEFWRNSNCGKSESMLLKRYIYLEFFGWIFFLWNFLLPLRAHPRQLRALLWNWGALILGGGAGGRIWYIGISFRLPSIFKGTSPLFSYRDWVHRVLYLAFTSVGKVLLLDQSLWNKLCSNSQNCDWSGGFVIDLSSCECILVFVPRS